LLWILHRTQCAQGYDQVLAQPSHALGRYRPRRLVVPWDHHRQAVVVSSGLEVLSSHARFHLIVQDKFSANVVHKIRGCRSVKCHLGLDTPGSAVLHLLLAEIANLLRLTRRSRDTQVSDVCRADWPSTCRMQNPIQSPLWKRSSPRFSASSPRIGSPRTRVPAERLHPPNETRAMSSH